MISFGYDISSRVTDETRMVPGPGPEQRTK